MMSSAYRFVRPRQRLYMLLVLGLGIGACRPAPTPVVPARLPSRTVSFAPSINRVKSLPLYHQAEQACRKKQFLQAVDLLTRLSRDASLSPAEAAFCQQQRQICLKDAGLLPTQLPSSAPSRVTLPIDADCGPRALAIVCQKLGVHTSVARLHQLAGTTERGTSFAGLAKAAEAVGLTAEGVQVSREALAEVDTPALAWVHQNHFIALLSVQGSGEQATATIHDPNQSREQTIPQEKLLQDCGGYLLLLRK